jgi:putative MATE family efflux protein
MNEHRDPQQSSATEASTSVLGILRAALRGDVRGEVARGDLRRAIPLLAIPMVLEMSMEALFAICDVFFVAHLGAGAIATIGLTESLLALLYAIAFGLAMPVTAIVARRIGEGDRAGAARSGAQAIWLGVAVGSLMAIPALAAPIALRLMGAEAAVVEQGSTFAAISMATSPVIVLLFVNNAVFRGAGDAVRAMRALWIANGINIVLDPCFIFGLGPFPEMGLTGAAVATAIGRSCGLVYQLGHLWMGKSLRLRGHFDFDSAIAARILRLSWGGTAQHLVETGSWVLLVRIVAGFGSTAVAGYTVAMRIATFTLLPAWGFSNATATLVGQSLGAGDPERAARSVWLSGIYNMVFLGLIAMVLLVVPEQIAASFTDDAGVSRSAATAMRILAVGYLFYAWQMVTQQAFNGAGDTSTPAWINFGCFWLAQLPLAWLLAHPVGMGPDGVYVAIAASYSLAALVSIVVFRRGRWRNVVV